MSFRPVRKIAGIGNVFLGTELVDIAEYELEIYEENPTGHPAPRRSRAQFNGKSKKTRSIHCRSGRDYQADLSPERREAGIKGNPED
jgi:hypothetical protein